jgi:hypothetical protein
VCRINLATALWVSSITAALLAIGPFSSPAPALSLPDGRVYELVSPADKSGGVGGVFPLGSLIYLLEQFHLPLQSSPNGDEIAYQGEDFYKPRLGSINQYLSLRGPETWSTLNLTPGLSSTTEEPVEANQYVGFSPDLSVGVISSGASASLGGAEEAPKGYVNLYLAEGSSLQPLLRIAPPDRTPETFGYADKGRPLVESHLLFAGGNSGAEAVPAFSHLLFAANDALPATGAVNGGKLKNNLYEWAGGSLRLVNVLPAGETEPGASFGINYGDRYNNAQLPSLSHVISADGSRIFWTDENGGPNNGNLYVREDGERTTLIAVGGQFQTASVDGTRVFYIKEEHLYEYNIDSKTTTDLDGGGGGGVEGVIGASNDGRYIYFVSTSALTENAHKGEPNLYLSQEGSLGEHALSLVETLLPEDDASPGGYGGSVTPGDWFETFAGRTAEVSPSGRYVAFMSKKSLTGYNNADATRGRQDYEVFLYDSASGTLVCASCNTDGSRPTSHTLLPAPVNGVYQQRYLDDGGRLFFSTEDAVLPQDTNGASDVYEYESGHVYLISPGDANDEAVFADASESGNDVFFTTRQQLVPADRDPILDLYDARVGGRPEEPPLPPCSGETCHEPTLVAPSFEAPVSAAFTGPGNPTPPVSKVVAKAKPLTRAQQLARALKACRVKQGRHRRASCQARARRRY